MSTHTAQRTVVHFSDSEAFGGTERALLQLMGGLDRARWRPVLFHSDVPGALQLREEASALGAAVQAVPHADGPSRGVRGIPALVRALRRERASVFHAHQIWSLSCRYGITAAALARVPARVATAQLFVEMPPLLGIDLQHALLTRCLHRHIAVSTHVAARIHDRFSVPTSKITVVPNAAATSLAVQPDPRLRADISGGTTRPVVLTVARLEAQKGLPHLLDAAALVPDAVFAIAGDGPDRAALEAQASALGVTERIRFLGHRRDVPALLASADLFVLPSLYEGLPLAALEAMAAGVPVVATAIGGTNEIVRDGETGTLVPPGDGAALGAAINRVLADRATAARLALTARALVQREFSVESMVRGVSRVYEELLSA